MTLTKFSDFLRLSILIKHGGLWVDSTCFCNKPLDEWLPEKCFIFQNLKMSYEISTWFIYSEPEHALIKTWYETANRIDKETISASYFCFYEIFDELCKQEWFNDEWKKIERINQNDSIMYFDLLKRGNLHVQHDGFLEPITDDIKSMIENKEKYVFKLSYKYQGEATENSILNFLFSTIEFGVLFYNDDNNSFCINADSLG
jgi:mannosyltransferase OCH1-like enzyme